MSRAFVTGAMVMAVFAGLGSTAHAAISEDNAVLFLNSPTADNSGLGGPPLTFFATTSDPSPSHLNSTWWYYRINGDHSREFGLTGPSVNTESGSQQNLTFETLEFKMLLRLEVLTTGPLSGSLVQRLTVTNKTGAPLSVSLFNYMDPDLGGEPLNTASVVDTNVFGISSADWYAEWSGVGATAFQAETRKSFPLTPTFFGLTDNALTNFSDTGLPSGSATNVTLGYQWDLNVPTSFSRSVTSTLSVTPIPEPSTMLPAMPVVGLLLMRRRRA